MYTPFNTTPLLFACLALLTGCDDDNTPTTQVSLTPTVVESQDEFSSSFRVRNAEIRADIIATLTERDIPFRLGDDGSIAYREIDGEAIDAAYYYVVGLYAARN